MLFINENQKRFQISVAVKWTGDLTSKDKRYKIGQNTGEAPLQVKPNNKKRSETMEDSAILEIFDKGQYDDVLEHLKNREETTRKLIN